MIVGFLAVRRPAAGVIGIGVFGLVGAFAAVHRPGESGGQKDSACLAPELVVITTH